MTLDGRVRGLETLETPRFSGARVYNSGNLSIADSSDVTLIFDSTRYDTDGYHSTSSSPDRLTAPVSGYYLITTNVQFASNVAGRRLLQISQSGGVGAIAQTTVNPVNAPTRLALATQAYLTAGDYVIVRVYQNSGGALSVEAAANYSPEFAIALLG